MDILGSPESTAQAVDSWVSCWQRIRAFASFCDEIDRAKRAAVESRKKLASDTKEHRRLWTSILNTPTNGVTPPDSTSPASDGTENAESVKTTIEKAESLKTATEQLLKGYQQEVDALTRRAKAAESTFLTLLQLMLQQPDLMVILRDLQASAESAKPTAADSVSRAEYENVMKECAAQRTAAQDLAARNATLEREYHELETEVGRVKDQTVTVRRLEQQLRQRQREFHEMLERALAEKEQKIRNELSGADSQAQRQLAEMAQQLEAAQQQVARLEGRMMQQQQQFVITRGELERKCQSLSSQIELLNSRGYQQDSRSISASADANSASTLRALQAAQERVKELLNAESELEAKLTQEKQLRKHVEEMHEASLAEALKRAEDLGHRVNRLEKELAERPTEGEVSELKRRLSSLSPSLANEAERQETLSRLRAENTRLTAQVQEANAAAEAAKAQAAAVVKETEEKLRGLLTTQSAAAAEGSPSSAAGGPQGAAPSAVGAGVLQLVVAQRETYKNRLAEAEQERDKWRSLALAEQQRRDTLAADNFQLARALESARYDAASGRGAPGGAPKPCASSVLSRYAVEILEESDTESRPEETDTTPPLPLVSRHRQNAGGTRTPRRRGGSFVTGVMAVADSVAHAAADTARSILGPKPTEGNEPQGGGLTSRHNGERSTTLSVLRDRRKQEHLHQLSVGERVVVIWGRMLLSSRATRIFALIYFSLLHFLVFLVLFFAADFASNSAGGPTHQHAYLNE